MNKNTKYIKITGIMKTAGEYVATNPNWRPYENVTFVDTDGLEIHFEKLGMIPRLDDNIGLGKTCTFYIIRQRTPQGKLYGELYAVETELGKFFYPELTNVRVQDFAFATTKRGGYVNAGGVVVLALVMAFFAGWAGAVISDASNISMGTAFLATFLPPLAYTIAPIFNKAKIADIKGMLANLKAEGFDIHNNATVEVASKY